MYFLRSRCAPAGIFLLAATIGFMLPAPVRAQSNFDRNVVAAADQVVSLIAQSANSRRNRGDLGELRSALDQLLNVLEQPRSGNDGKGRHDEHRGHLRHGFDWSRHENRGEKRFDRDDRRADDKTAHKNRIGAMPGQPPQLVRAQVRAQKADDAGHAKLGGGAGAAEARRGRNLAPVGQNADQQQNPPGIAKQGAGPGNLQAKNGAGGRFGNGQNVNQAGNPNSPGVAKNGHHHHHHFGESKGAGSGPMGKGQAMGKCKNGMGPQGNQVRAKTGNNANPGNAQALNNGGPMKSATTRNAGNTRPTNNASQNYANQMMTAFRTPAQNQRPTANSAQRPQGSQHAAGNAIMRPFLGNSHAGNSVGQRSAGHSAHAGRR